MDKSSHRVTLRGNGSPFNIKRYTNLYETNNGWYRFNNVTKIVKDGEVKDYSFWNENATTININSLNIEEH